MLPQIHILDLIAVACITAGFIVPFRKQIRRLGPSRIGVVASFLSLTLLVGFTTLHVWAQVRPLPPMVEISRYLRSVERDDFRNQLIAGPIPAGFVLPDINRFTTSEYIPLDHVSLMPVQEADIREIKRLLAWNSWFPEMPKELIIVPDWHGEGMRTSTGDYFDKNGLCW